MIINTPGAPTKLLTDLDITSIHGLTLPITIDETLGDTLTITGETINIHLASKPMVGDPSKTLPAEDIVVYIKNIFCTQTRQREAIARSPELESQWQETLSALATSSTSH